MGRGAPLRGSLRLRLTALYGGLFLVAGVALLAITYALVAGRLNRRGSGPPDLGPLPEPWEGGRGPFGTGGDGDPAPGERLSDGLDLLRELTGEAAARQREEALDQLLVQSAIALGITAVLAIGLGWVVAGRALRPVRAITATARRLSTHNLDERIGLHGGGGELKELADTFDAMLSRLAAAFEAQRRFAANASHELRTPLTVQRAAIDVALAHPTTESLTAMAMRVRASTERHERLIAGLLMLARSQAGVAAREEVDLATLAAAALTTATSTTGSQAEGGHKAAGPTAERRLGAARLSGDPVLLERLAVNLVDNAVRYNVPGGRLTVETHGDGRSAVLRVANTGPAVPQQDVAALFEPFRRLVPDRTGPPTGFGLGLSIVAAVCAAHDGTCVARAREEGGLDVTVTLPAAPAHARLTPARPAVPPPDSPAGSPAASP
ncbi:HAMP domain-containing sensor histidine kinase [Streptomyces sp. WMMC500]|uniref:sensor histidine kinase n=1 Tax=Streptomyces sp. WMMC500 TaxID=3015154 RepID=UPI00248C0EB5|nr:HAMP domain-containing sensor histidine kinase [Streptomyces sp. WMMC500]WBB62381.1 HAMP domain-containing sensor histidine kinase [Streptomyces sp. WMMC500]